MKQLSTKAMRLLAWLKRSEGGLLLESQVVGSGMDREINTLILSRLATLCDHPSVKSRGSLNLPATAVVLTELGRKA